MLDDTQDDALTGAWVPPSIITELKPATAADWIADPYGVTLGIVRRHFAALNPEDGPAKWTTPATLAKRLLKYLVCAIRHDPLAQPDAGSENKWTITGAEADRLVKFDPAKFNWERIPLTDAMRKALHLPLPE